MTVDLATGVELVVEVPVSPTVTVEAPTNPVQLIVPIAGPAGPPGAPGGDMDAIQEAIDDSIDLHVQAPTPHPAYDDLQSLTLLFENGLV